MKTLKESILANMDDTIASGDDYIKGIAEEMNYLHSKIGVIKSYDKLSSRVYVNGRRLILYFNNLLKALGYDANAIEITIFPLEGDVKDWHLDIFLYKRDGGYTCRSVYDHTIYLYNGHFKKIDDILKDLLKPATKDSDSFKHFLDKVAHYEGQLITRVEQLLK